MLPVVRLIPRTSRLTFAAVLAALACGPGTLAADSVVLSEPEAREMMARYIRNFTRFVRWPDSAFPHATAPLKVCSLGSAPFSVELTSELEGRSIKDRAYAFVELDPNDLAAAESCNIVYVQASTTAEAEGVVAALDGKPVLTVGVVDGFARAGGMIGIVAKDEGIAMQINRTRLERNALSASSRLYQIGN